MRCCRPQTTWLTPESFTHRCSLNPHRNHLEKRKLRLRQAQQYPPRAPPAVKGRAWILAQEALLQSLCSETPCYNLCPPWLVISKI